MHSTVRNLASRIARALARKPKPATMAFDATVAKPGDVVIIQPRECLTREQWRMARDYLDKMREREGLSDVKFLLLDHSAFELSIVQPEGDAK